MTDRLRAAAQAALEALEIGYDAAKAEADQFHSAMAGYKQQRHAQMDADVQRIAGAITDLRAALAEPEVEQEPVAWWMPEHLRHQGKWFTLWVHDGPKKPPIYAGWVPLYTAPPRREWQGLTEEEVNGLWVSQPTISKFARAIEAALKEKNHD